MKEETKKQPRFGLMAIGSYLVAAGCAYATHYAPGSSAIEILYGCTETAAFITALIATGCAVYVRLQ